jgi:predicted dehydrogenase
MKVGLVGCGKHANTHAETVRSSDFAEIAACADVNLDRANEFAAKHGIPHTYNSLEAMVKAEPLDMVVFVAFPAVHAELTNEALKLNVKAIARKRWP